MPAYDRDYNVFEEGKDRMPRGYFSSKGVWMPPLDLTTRKNCLDFARRSAFFRHQQLEAVESRDDNLSILVNNAVILEGCSNNHISGVGIIATGVIDGGTTEHIIRRNVLERLQEKGIAPAMIPMERGEMGIAFGRDDNPEPVVGSIDTAFGKIVVVENMSAEALLSEKEFTNIGACIVKDNNTLAIIHNNQLLLYGTRKPSSKPGSNDQLWLANIEDMFKLPPTLDSCHNVHDPMAAIASIIDSATRTAEGLAHANSASPLQSKKPTIQHAIDDLEYEAEDGETLHFISTDAAGQRWAHLSKDSEDDEEEDSQPVQDEIIVMAEDAHTYSAKPTWTAVEHRLARNLIWGCNGSAIKLANTLEANAMALQPSIDPKLLRFIGDQRNDPAYRMTHDVAIHPGGSGDYDLQPGEESRADIVGLWKQDKGVNTSLALLITDVKSKFTKVYALDNKTTAADAINKWRDLWAQQGRQVKRVKFDYASEVSADYVKRINEHLINPNNLRSTLSSSSSRSAQGVEVSKAPKEAHEVMVEAHWKSIKKDFSRALIAQNNVPQQDFWFWALKDTAEAGNAFICSGHPTKTPFEQVYERKPSAVKACTVPWGQLVVFRHIHGNESGLVRATAPPFELGVIMGRPLEQDGTYLVLRPNTTVPVEVQDIRPLEIDELRLTDDQWHDR
jgi:hypothetical protein